MTEQIVHKPTKGETFVLLLGRQAEFGSTNQRIVYCGMPNPDVYSIGIHGSVPSNSDLGHSVDYSHQVFVPKDLKSLDSILEGIAQVEVVKVEPLSLILKYVN